MTEENKTEVNVQESQVEESVVEQTQDQRPAQDEQGGFDSRDARRSRSARNPHNRRRRNDRRRDRKKDSVRDEVIHIGRVAKTVKGGRNIRFTALVIAGDGEGQVGKGLGKAAEVPDAIRKGSDEARKSMIKVPISGTTIPHEVLGVFGGGKVLLKPAPEGTGVIAGGPVRTVCDMCGIKDIRTKSLGSNNPNNMVNATFEGLKQLSSIEEVAKKRGKSISEIIN